MSDRRIEDLLARMTWAEKLGQLQITYHPDPARTRALISAGMGSIFWQGDAEATNAMQRHAVENTRLGIPLLVGLDVIHGQRTIFPTPLALAASFEPRHAEQVARVSGREAASGGVNWTFSPMVDVSRDPRWGRIVEGFGEDVLLNSCFGAAMVRGYQGDDLSAADAIAATAKHFVGYGQPEGGRDYNTADMSEYRLRNVYLPPFQAVVEAGAASVMASFNTIDGLPVHANRRLLTGVLREEWGFDGVIVGDADGVMNLIPHGIAANAADALKLAFAAGLNVEMGGNVVTDGVPTLSEAELSPAVVDAAVRRVLALKAALGLFERPYVVAEREIVAATPDHRDIARRMAPDTMVLLKNDGDLLPLADRARILVTGPYAESTDHLGAWVQAFATPAGRIIDALRERLPGTDVVVSEGASFLGTDEAALRAAAASQAAEIGFAIVFAGEPSNISGEAASRSDLRLPGEQEALINAIADTGVPFVVVLESGRPLVVSDWFDRAPAVLQAWHLGTEAPAAIVSALMGDTAPSGKLPASFPRSSGQVPTHYSHDNTGRPATTGGSMAPTTWDPALHGPNNVDDKYASKYLDLDLGPLLPFGHGLTYTRFEYSGAQLRERDVTLDALRDGATFGLEITLTNVGDRAGDEIVQVYTHDVVAHRVQPVRVLRRFTRVHLGVGESRAVSFELGFDDLAFWSESHSVPGFDVEPGAFEVFIGGSSEAPLAARITVGAPQQSMSREPIAHRHARSTQASTTGVAS